MIQNLIALAIVFLATGYVVFTVVRSLTAKKTSPCSGCKGCGLKEIHMVCHTKPAP